MILVAWVLWLLLLLTIPLFLLKVSGYSYSKGTESSKVIGRLLLSFLGYFVISFITFFLLLVSIVGAEPRPIEQMAFGEKIMSLAFVLGYGFAGWLLCSFVNEGFINPRLLLSLKTEK